MEVVNHPAHTVYHLEFANGKVVGIQYFSLITRKNILHAQRGSNSQFSDIFDDVIAAACHDRNFTFDDFDKLFKLMYDDEEYCERANKAMAEELMCMSKQVERITRLYWINYLR